MGDGPSVNSPWYLPDMGEKYSLKDLGPRASFYVPASKLSLERPQGETAEEFLHGFLSGFFEYVSCDLVQDRTRWTGTEIVEDEEFRLYTVAPVGDRELPVLVKYLASFAQSIEVEAIELQLGSPACLIRP